MSEPICRHLRWREHSGATAGTGERLAHALSLGGPFTCGRTCEAWGPDDDLAAPERCDPERACFAPPPEEPAA